MKTKTAESTGRNAILGALGADEMERLAPHLKRVRNELSEVLLQPGHPIDTLYFPVTAMASAMGLTAEGGAAEVGVIGWEGVVGAARLLGADSQPNVINIQMPGEGLLLPADIAQEEFVRGGAFQKAVLLYVNELLVQIGRTAVCNAMHAVDERLAKWLLMCRDRSPDTVVRLTQEFLALMVGSTRQSVSGAAGKLQDRGIVRYSRGAMEILDRPALESVACDCYQIVSLKRAGEVN